MAQESDELRQQIDSQRAEISDTMNQIENRVTPSRIAARQTDRMKYRMMGWKAAVFGSDDGGSQNGLSDRASSAADTIKHSPELARRETRGNPMAAGAIAMGAGWLVAGLIPESRQERKLVERAEPKIAEAASAVKAEGEAIAEEMREPAQDAAKEMQETTKDAAQHVKSSSKSS